MNLNPKKKRKLEHKKKAKALEAKQDAEDEVPLLEQENKKSSRRQIQWLISLRSCARLQPH